MDGKHFSLITIAIIILLGIVGLGFMQMQTNTSLSAIANRLTVVEKQAAQAPVTTATATTAVKDADANNTAPVQDIESKKTGYTFEGWSYEVPSDYVVTKGVQDPTLTITSKSGTFFRGSSGGPLVKPLANEFTSGIQLNIIQVGTLSAYYPVSKTYNTSNLLVKSAGTQSQFCDGAGCATELYFIQKNGATWEVDVDYSSDVTAAARKVVDEFIASIK